jgi:PKHD-type hydroxylase
VTFVLGNVVSADRVQAIRQTMAGGTFQPGSSTAVGGAARLKHNLQLAPDSPAAAQASEILVGGLRDSPAFMAATCLEAMTAPLFVRYEPGMAYGDHIDAALMGEPPMQLRCDIAITVALVGPDAYDGGELVIDAGGAAQRWKGAAGDCIVYGADTLHHVDPVTRGAREVAVFWVQTLVRDEWKRRVLYDLRAALEHFDTAGAAGAGAAGHVEALRRSYYNLIRRWA